MEKGDRSGQSTSGSRSGSLVSGSPDSLYAFGANRSCPKAKLSFQVGGAFVSLEGCFVSKVGLAPVGMHHSPLGSGFAVGHLMTCNDVAEFNIVS
jgi:hypothetical protein